MECVGQSVVVLLKMPSVVLARKPSHARETGHSIGPFQTPGSLSDWSLLATAKTSSVVLLRWVALLRRRVPVALLRKVVSLLRSRVSLLSVPSRGCAHILVTVAVLHGG